MGVEHVARIGLASGRTPHQQRQLPIGLGLLREVVVDNQRVPALVHEVLGHRRAGIRRDVLQRSRLAGAGHHDGRVVHGAVLPQDFDHAGHGRILLTDRDVKALYAGVALVEDGVDADGGLARLAIADDQFSLSAADGRHRIDGLDAGLQRLCHRQSLGHARRPGFDVAALAGDDRTLAVDWISQRVDHAADHGVADRHAQQPARALDLVALGDLQVVPENDNAHRVLFEVEGQADGAVGKLDHFAGHHARQAVDARDAVAHFEHATDFAHVDLRLEGLNFRLDHRSDLVCFESHGYSW